MFKEVVYQSLNMEMAVLLKTILFSWVSFQFKKKNADSLKMGGYVSVVQENK